MVNDYPSYWHRRLDFMPPLGVQVEMFHEGNLEVFELEAKVTVQKERALGVKMQTPHGILKITPFSRTEYSFKFGTTPKIFDKKNMEIFSQKEIYNEIEESAGNAIRLIDDKMLDIDIKEKGAIEKLPKELENLDKFQGEEQVFYIQKASGSYPHKINKILGIRGIRLPNIYDVIKNELLSKSIFPTSSDIFHHNKLRSVIRTEWMKTDNNGWEQLRNLGILQIEQFLIKNKWWLDIGTPQPFPIPFDSLGIQGQIYKLRNRNIPIFI